MKQLVKGFIKKLISLSLLFFISYTWAADRYTDHPFYAGLLGGYGDTDWSRLVSEDELTAEATPISASGDGFVYGAFVGYQPFHYFAFELQYMRFPDADLVFEPGNAMGINNTISKTDYTAAIVKVLVPVGEAWRVFGDIGIAYVRREDDISDIHNTRPTFGFGADYAFTDHWFSSLSFEYTPGTGEAVVDASAEYIPYLYSIQLGIGYRF